LVTSVSLGRGTKKKEITKARDGTEKYVPFCIWGEKGKTWGDITRCCAGLYLRRGETGKKRLGTTISHPKRQTNKRSNRHQTHPIVMD